MAAAISRPDLAASIHARIQARAAAPPPPPVPEYGLVLQQINPGVLDAPEPPKPKLKLVTRLRKGHSWYSGHAGTYTNEQLGQLAGRWVACPGCTADDQAQGRCHLCGLQDAFRDAFPDRECFKMCSLATDVVEGKGGLRDVLVEKDAVFAGVLPKRGSPHGRELGIRLEESLFGNPNHPAAVGRREAQKRKREEAAEAEAARPAPRDRRHHFIEYHWSCTCVDWQVRKAELPQASERVCKHILGVQDDLDLEANRKAAAKDLAEGYNPKKPRPAPHPFAPGQLYAEGKGYKPVYQTKVVKRPHVWTWEVERSSAGSAADMDDYVVKRHARC